MAAINENTPFPTSASVSAGSDAARTAQENVNAAAQSAGEMIDRLARSAHDLVDRMAGKAGPAVERMRTSFTGARENMRSRADDLSVKQEEWLGHCRDSVRERPLTAVAIGVVAGMILGKILSR